MLARRQDLEARAEPIFMPPAKAAAALRCADRRVCFLTHAWRSGVHPDPDLSTLDALVRFLRHPLGQNVVGVFVDFACGWNEFGGMLPEFVPFLGFDLYPGRYKHLLLLPQKLN